MQLNASPWLLAGDFNTARFSYEKVGGRPLSFSQLNSFNDFISNCSLLDMRSMGSTWTQNNKSHNYGRIAGRLDRILCNSHWLDILPLAFYEFLPHSTSDHCCN